MRWLLALVVVCGGQATEPTASTVPRVRVTYDVDFEPPPSAADLESAARTVHDQLAGKLKGNVVARPQGAQIVVEIDADQVDALHGSIAKSSSLAFEVVDTSATWPPPTQRDEWTDGDGHHHAETFPVAADRHALEAALAHQPVPADHELAFGQLDATHWRAYMLVRSREVTGKHVAAVRPAAGGVAIDLTGAGARAFAALSTAHVGDKVAIVVDGTVVSAPVIESPIRGGKLVVDVPGDSDAVAEVVKAVHVASLPAPLREVSVTKL